LNSRLKTKQRPQLAAQTDAASAHVSHASFSGCAHRDAIQTAVETQIAAAMAPTTVVVENK
jgi:hypothetical protein